MSDIAPGWPLQVQESTDNHWVAICRDLVLVFAYEGSHDDVGHVHATTRAIDSVHRQSGVPAKLLFVLPPLHSKPPDARVRSAIAQASKRLDGRVARGAVVVSGTGFAAAVHRGAVAGILTLLRPKVPVRVVGNARDGLAHLLGDSADPLKALTRLCEERMRSRPA